MASIDLLQMQAKEGLGGVPGYWRARGSGSQLLSWLWLATILMVGFLLILPTDSYRSDANLHTLLEVVSMLLATLVGVHALVRYYARPDPIFLTVGSAFIGAAILDGYHAVVTAEAFIHLMPSELDQLIPWSWAASRFYLMGIILLGFWIQLSVDQGEGGDRASAERTIYMVAALALTVAIIVFTAAPLPQAHYDNLFLPRPQELGPGIMALAALAVLLRSSSVQRSGFRPWLVLFLTVTAICQLLFMSRSGAVYDASFDIAHLLKIYSYLIVEIGLLVAMRDVVQEAQSSRRSLAEAHAELQRYIRIASHDLKGPVRNIDSIARWIEEDLGGDADSALRSNVQRIRTRIGRLDRMLDGLLDYSQIGRLGTAITVTDPNRLARDAFEAADPPPDLKLSIPEPLPEIPSQTGLLGAVFSRIIDNAVRFHDTGVGRIEVRAAAHAGRIRFEVTDDGPGIPPEYRQRVFDLFQTLHPRDHLDTTGVGLTIARQALSRIGGAIWIEDGASARGLTVCFSVPRAPLETPQSFAPSASPALQPGD